MGLLVCGIRGSLPTKGENESMCGLRDAYVPFQT